MTQSGAGAQWAAAGRVLCARRDAAEGAVGEDGRRRGACSARDVTPRRVKSGKWGGGGARALYAT